MIFVELSINLMKELLKVNLMLMHLKIIQKKIKKLEHLLEMINQMIFKI